MTEPIDPIEMIREADPSEPNTVSSASLARVSARVQEMIMSDIDNGPTTSRLRRSRAAIGGLTAAIAALALIAIVSTQKPTSPVAVAPSATAVASPTTAVPSPTAMPDPTPVPPSVEPSDGGPNTGGGGVAACIRYDTAILAGMDLGFDGTVTDITGEQVTFRVNRAFKGVAGEAITLTNPGGTLGNDGSLDMSVGDHLLVAGSGSAINACGYTQPYDAAVAAEWASAFGN